MSSPTVNESDYQEDQFESYELRSLIRLLNSDLGAYALRILVRLPLEEFAELNVAQFIWYSLGEYIRKESLTSDEEEFLSLVIESAVYIPSVKIREQLYTLLEQRKGVIKKQVLYALSRVRDEKVLKILVDLVQDPENETRTTDAFYLAYHDISSVQERVKELCLYDPNGNLRLWLAISLAKQGETNGLFRLLDDWVNEKALIEIFGGDPSTPIEEINKLGGIPEDIYGDQRIVEILEKDSYLNTVFARPIKPISPESEEELTTDVENEKEAVRLAESILNKEVLERVELRDDSEILVNLPEEEKSRFIFTLFKEIIEKAPASMPHFILGNSIVELPSRFWRNFRPDIVSLYQLYISDDTRDYGFQQHIIWTMTRGGHRLLITELSSILSEADDAEKKIILDLIYESLGYKKTSYAPLFGGSTPKVDIQPRVVELREMDLDPKMAMVGPPDDKELKMQPGEERYVDFVFYNEENELVNRHHPLVADTWYNLEVAVRFDPKGIQPEKPPEPFPVIHEEKSVELFVSLDSSDFEIEQPVQTLTLPPKGESYHNPWFMVRPTVVTPSEKTRSVIKVKIFYNMNLIEDADIRVEVIPKYYAPESLLGFEFPITFERQLEYKYDDFDKIIPRSMNIDIEKRDDQYIFTFTMSSKTDDVELTAPVMISELVLEDHLMEARDTLDKIVLNKIYKEQIEAKGYQFRKVVRELAKQGRRLWNKLFRDNLDDSISIIGRFLQDNPVKDGGIIQVTVKPNASDFVFPWSLLYDKDIPDDEYQTPDTHGFWGLRYVIEQKMPRKPTRIVYNDLPVEINDPISLDYFLWPFHNSTEQTAFLEDIEKKSNGMIEVSEPPITDTARGYDILSQGRSEILYFYTHGFIKPRKAFTSADYVVKYYKRQLDKMKPTDEEYLYYKSTYESFDQAMSEDESYIKVADGQFTWDKLIELDKFVKPPIVILNMCNSAQISPTLTDNFVDLFLSRGALSVVGTECPMTPLFAHNFSKIFFKQFLEGDSIGESLLYTRQHFMDKKNNPCALAYTLYGSATSKFSPNPL